MRIVQTFWTAGRDPLKYSFGWAHPEYNLMSWALSCLSLREHYDEVALYTDQEGYDVLINKLHLPYTEVNVVYDKNLCLPQHWAYAKIKTYSMQTKPFIHVDGDVYLPHPIPEDIANAPLIAQNREIGTSYYRDMMYRVLHNPEIQLPKCVERGLQEDSIASYNMGVFGGNDLQFILQYCNEVQKFFDTNGLNNPERINSRIECNVFFEQILLAAMADEKKKKVGCAIAHDMYDQSYTISEFCNLYRYSKVPLHHLLGGHKRNEYVLRMLRHSFAHKYPKMYGQIYKLTKLNKQFVIAYERIQTNPVKDHLTHLLAFIKQQVKRWLQIDINSYIAYESSLDKDYLDDYDEEYLEKISLKINPYLCIFTLSNEESDSFDQLRMWLHCERNFPLKNLAIIPVLIGAGYELTPLLQIDMEIIAAIRKKNLNFKSIAKCIKTSRATDKTVAVYLNHYIKEELIHLIQQDVIIVLTN